MSSGNFDMPPGSIIDTEEKDASNLHEKRPPSEVSYDLGDGDEALHLVGAQRTTNFTEEFNEKLRRKLVSDASGNHPQSPSHSYFSTGSTHPAHMCGGLFHPIPR